MDISDLKEVLYSIKDLIEESKDYLIELDQQIGDGDLGLSMVKGFSEVSEYLKSTDGKDLGKVLYQCGNIFNEAAPSTLGTIISFGFMGMAKPLRNKEDASFSEIVDALENGLKMIMEKGKTKPGDKTIIDSLYPAIIVLKENKDKNPKLALEEAYKAAKAGVEKTKKMASVHGRAAYYGEKSIGFIDGGAVVGKLIIKGICNWKESINEY